MKMKLGIREWVFIGVIATITLLVIMGFIQDALAAT